MQYIQRAVASCSRLGGDPKKSGWVLLSTVIDADDLCERVLQYWRLVASVSGTVCGVLSYVLT